ncbi:MAG: hypothetical protein J3T61_04120, partial [Candidatus Brocadiales bacterium]|nr:hypothetical protein [Candidatus Bathyanammoxibius sp.]
MTADNKVGFTRPIRRGKAWAKPGFVASVFFLLLFTGPPKFRFRDAEASLYGELDFASIMQILIWGVVGAWTGWQFVRRWTRGIRPVRFRGVYSSAILFVLVLGASTFVSFA